MQIKDMINSGFAPKDNSKLIYIASSPEDALDYIDNYSPIEVSDKIGA